jgi:cephalosporin hydroxylase
MLYEKLEGWFSYSALYDQAVEISKDGDILIEIGTWLGRSATYLAEKIIESGKKIKVICVDPYYMGLHGLEKYGRHSMERFIYFHEFSVNHNLNQILVPVLSTSKEFAPVARNLSNVRMVFIDGNHTLEGCRSDIHEYYPIGADIFAGHDYDPVNWNGVVEAVDTFAKQKKLQVEVVADYWRLL